jgi:hypothetical protein
MASPTFGDQFPWSAHLYVEKYQIGLLILDYLNGGLAVRRLKDSCQIAILAQQVDEAVAGALSSATSGYRSSSFGG